METSFRKILLFSVSVVLFIIAIVYYSFNVGVNIAERHAPLVDASMEIRLEATTAHLWLEEILSGDRTSDIEKVWGHLDQSKWYAQAMLDGGTNKEGSFIALTDPNLRSQIEKTIDGINRFRQISEQRWASKSANGNGSDIEQQFDLAFLKFTLSADSVETALQKTIVEDLQTFKLTQRLLMSLIILLGLVVSALLLRSNTKQINTMRVLQKQEESTRITLSSIGDAVITTDTNSVVIFMNPVALKLTGWTSEQAIGQPLAEVFNIVHSHTLKTIENPVRNVLETGKVVVQTNPTMLIAMDGAEYYISKSASPIRSSPSNISGVVLVFRDISDEYVQRKALESSQSLIKNLFNNIPDLIWLKDKEGVYLTCNKKFEQFFGAKESEIIGKTDYDFVDEDIADFFRENDKKAMMLGKPSMNEEPLTFESDGHTELCETIKNPLFNSRGELTGILGVARNITARKFAERREKYHSHILKLITSGELLPVILEAIVLGVEDENPSMICSILLLDEEGKHLLNGAAPSLPDFYNQATHGMDIGVGAGSCGTSAFTGERVIVDDIQNHPYWINFKEAAGKAGLGACWSQPIHSTEGKVLGTFAIYHHDIHKPTAQNIELIEQVADLSSIAIEHTQTKLTLQSSEERYAFAIKGTQDGIWDWNVSTNEIMFTPRWKSMLGYAENEIKDEFSEWERLVHPDDLEITLSIIKEFLSHKTENFKAENFKAEFRMQHKDGHYINILSRAFASEDEAGEITRLVGTHVDITQQKLSEEKLTLAASVFMHAGESIAITDATGKILDVNDTFSHTTGYSREEAIGKNPRILQSGRQSSQFYTDMWQALLNEGYWSGEVWNRRKNGEVYAVMATISAVRDVHGDTTHYVSLANDITPIKHHQEQLERIAHFDLLTNLPNRTLLADRLSQAMLQCGRHEQSLAVVFLDLDGFKTVNDTHGHSVGDELLIVLSLRMKEALRENDTLSRIGGDEFVAVLADLDKVEDCEPVLERLLLAASEPIVINNVVLNVSASIGVTLYPQDNVDTDQLIRHADQAMYVAKQSGKNRYHLFDTVQDDAIKVQRENLEAIRSALDNQQFVLHYQPKVNMKTGRVMGAEALIRWQHPTRGLLSPMEFLPVIENHAMMIEMGEWVIDSALSQISQWQKMGLTLPISTSVNIAAVQLQQSDFTQRLTKQLAEHPDVDPCYLELEVLETSALDDVHHVSTIMNDCMALGVNFALDDFGTGYSSLTYLRRLPASLIKIDQTFVLDMLNDPDDLAIVEGVIALAKSFKRDVIAEGVETIEHGTALLQLGCELAQGYGIAKPMPASDIPEWIRDWKPDITWSI
jgi:diguanylate cyclase (GGDEF)-like protein/PAS domain S-box-containing protein